MDPYSIDIKKVFISHLKKKGIEEEAADRFIKDLINSKFSDPGTSLNQVSDYLKKLGWDDTAVDYQTLQLAQAYLESSNSSVS
jgi:hypothetical protein